MSIVHQGNTPAAAVFAASQHRACGNASLPPNVERMQRADRIRFTHFSNVAAGLAVCQRGNAP